MTDRTKTFTSRFAALSAVALGGCGGDADADASSAAEDSEAAAPSDGAGMIVATVGDLSYSFDLAAAGASCSVFGGEVIFGSATGPDGSDVNFEFPTEGSEYAEEANAYIVVNDPATGSEWAAGTNDLRQLEPGTSQIDSMTIEGNTASGEATFLDLSLDEGRTPTPGSFNVTCP